MGFPGSAQDTAKIKISGDPVTRIYKVFFASETDFNVRLTLTREANDQVIIDETLAGKGFMKRFSLENVPNGKYTWRINYGFEEYIEEFEILPVTKMARKTVKVDFDELLNLTIKVDPSNKMPLSIFLYNSAGEQIKYIFWEPKEGDFEKVINFSEFDAYDIKVEILQGGDPIFTETYSTY